MQRSDIETEIGRLLGDPNHDRWSVTALRDRTQEAQIAVQALTNAIRTVETLTPTAETQEVDINDNTIDIIRATITDSDGDILALEGRSRSDLDFYVPNWENQDSGKPTHFFYDASNNQLVLYPKPSADYAIADALKVWEVRIPEELTGDTDEPFDNNAAMQAYANSIVHWVVAQCWMDDGTPEALGKSRFHKSGSIENPGEFEKYIRLINAKFNAPSVIPARIKWYPQGGRVGGRRVSKSNPFGGY
ncbi:MAG TPA: DUF6682 family protein [Anaerolineales bacterium]|nr:DUF6682 family protein [Anaerolineales bacterium]